MKGGEDDVDALVGRGDVAMKEERWEDAVRSLADAFEKGGRESQTVSLGFLFETTPSCKHSVFSKRKNGGFQSFRFLESCRKRRKC